jgi:N-acetylmuramoyl-L-alanine amidase
MYPEAIVVSVHANAGGGTGFEVYTSVGETLADKYATIMFEEAKKELPEFKMRADFSDGDPDKESQFYILRHTKHPAMLTENLFMDTERDCRFIMSEIGRKRIADFHTKAIKRIWDSL